MSCLIYVMNRLGRGYNFEALRAKILFAEGAMKKHTAKPKFEHRPTVGPDAFWGRVTSFYVGSSLLSTQQPEREINYGVDISTLKGMIERSEI